ncbi:cupin domain-containing protein [bacterium]|nr:MAG: cupin domain-containing protein [bacterium]
MVSLLEEIRIAPKILGPGEGMAYSMGPEHTTVKLSSAETAGAFIFAEIHIDEPGFGPPYHVHTQEDELFTVLEGELILIVDGVRHVVPAGGTAYGPRNVPHRFESGPNGVRFNIMITGSNFERFHARYAEAFESGDMASLPAIAADHGISFLPEP